MSTEALSARDVTQRLLLRATASGDSAQPHVAATVACESACRELSRSLGASGFNALLTRALAQAEREHPLLKGLRAGRPPEVFLGGITTLVQQHGSTAVGAGLMSVLEEMISLLGRLIGVEMVARLVERRSPDETHDGEEVT